jgi:hypothetical protein
MSEFAYATEELRAYGAQPTLGYVVAAVRAKGANSDGSSLHWSEVKFMWNEQDAAARHLRGGHRLLRSDLLSICAGQQMIGWIIPGYRHSGV